MEDIFNEKLVKKLPDGKTTLIKILSGVAAIAIMTLGLMYAGIASLLIIAAVGAGIFFLWQQLEVEFEYILTNDELDVDKIIARDRRKSLLVVSVKDFEVFAPVNETYQHEFEHANVVKTVDASSSAKSTKRWFAVFNDGETRTMLIFEPGKKMRAGIKQLIPRIYRE